MNDNQQPIELACDICHKPLGVLYGPHAEVRGFLRCELCWSKAEEITADMTEAKCEV